MKKLIELKYFEPIYNVGGKDVLEKFSHINAVTVKDHPSRFVLENVTEEDLVAFKLMGARVENNFAFDASQIKQNGTTDFVVMLPGETEYRIFEIESHSYEQDT